MASTAPEPTPEPSPRPTTDSGLPLKPVYRAADALDRREGGATRLAAMAKRLVTDTGFEVVNGCLQLHGGYGYLRDHPIERVLRDLRVHQILEGTNEVMRLIVSRDLLGN